MSKLKSLTVNSLQLKIIGFLMTLVGAIAITFFSGETQQMTRLILEFISYPAIAIFAFLLVEGFHNTENMETYVLSLAVAAVVAEPFYDYACMGVWFDFGAANGQNFLFALLLCMAELMFLRSIGLGNIKRKLMICCLIPAAIFWAFILNVRFGILTVIMAAVFYILRSKPKARDITVGILGTVVYVTAGLSAPLIHKYNGERSKYPKYLFYALYPVMWMVLALIKFLNV